jgi:hypothetical protein
LKSKKAIKADLSANKAAAWPDKTANNFAIREEYGLYQRLSESIVKRK